MERMSSEQRERESREFVRDLSNILFEELGVSIDETNVTEEGCLSVTGEVLNLAFYQMHRHDGEDLI